MAIQQIMHEEILMEGDDTTTVETLHLVESVTLFTADELAQFTPMFGPIFCGQIGETECNS